MKKTVPIIFSFLLSFISAYSQLGEWTWIKGDSTVNGTGNFGTITVPSPTNVPEPRYACGSWTDTAGNFWVYSGTNANADLWKFDPKINTWAWMQGDDSTFDPNPYKQITAADSLGVYDPLNSPGQLGYGVLTWTAPNNHLWLYGGLLNTQSGNQQQLQINDDLWQYDPAINEWAWMGTFGPANWGKQGLGTKLTMPGGRQEGDCTWVDNSGNLWLFGGCDVNLNSYNDMWEYNVTTGIWTWVSGPDKKPNDKGQYGTLGQPLPGRYPSSRSTNFFWKDTAGAFWLSGGTEYTEDLFYEDTWKFDPKNLDWTWVNGKEGEDTTIVGVNCKLDSANNYGDHYENRATWKQCSDLIITYNGFHDWNTASDNSPTNDMWGYKISTDEWVKINEWGSVGEYGTQGVSSPLNYPKSRFGGVGFNGKDGSLWLFGGQYDVITTNVQQSYYFNDLWKYVFDTTCVSCQRSCNIIAPHVTTDKDTICASDSAMVCAQVSYTTYAWNTGVTGTGNCLAAKAAGDYYVTVTDATGCTAESNHIPISVYPVLPVPITQTGDTLISFGAVSYQWYLNGTLIPGATSDTLIAKYIGSYTVGVNDINGCQALSEPVSVTKVGVGVRDLDAAMFISIFPNPSSAGTWQLSVDNSLVGSKLEVYDEGGRLVWQSEIREAKSIIAPNVEGGIYWLRISSVNSSTVRKLIKL